MMGVKTFDDQIKAKKATFKGDRKACDQMRIAMSDFDPFFEMMPGTAEKKLARGDVKPLQIEAGTIDPNID
jgi:hypothetical protein